MKKGKNGIERMPATSPPIPSHRKYHVRKVRRGERKREKKEERWKKEIKTRKTGA